MESESLKVATGVENIPSELIPLSNPSAMIQPVVKEVDARGLVCPLPLLKAKQGLRDLAEGELIRIIATDAGSLKDFVSFAQITSQVIESFYAKDGVYYYLIRKK